MKPFRPSSFNDAMKRSNEVQGTPDITYNRNEGFENNYDPNSGVEDCVNLINEKYKFDLPNQ